VQVLGTRRGGLLTLTLAAIALAAAAAFLAWQFLERPSVDAPVPAPGSAVPDARPEIAFAVPDGSRLGGLTIRLDGADVTRRARSEGGSVVVTPPAPLGDGGHRVEVSFSSDNAFARTVRRDWDFQVDTAAPDLAVAGPEPGALAARRAVKFRGTAEPGARVVVAAGDLQTAAVAGADGAWQAVARLPEGRVRATVTATDPAGNATERTRRLTIDTTAPDLAVASPAQGEQISQTDEPLVRGQVGSDNPRGLTFTAVVNGKVVSTVRGADAASPSDFASGYGEAAGTTVPLEIDGRRFAMSVGTLPQGRSTIRIVARDRAGNVSRTRTVVHIDSTDEFGAADIVAGARGPDVRELQQRLLDAKVYPKKAKLTGVMDPVTVQSLRRYQKRFDLPRTGVVDERTRRAMVGRIVVTISQRKLRLIRNGRVVKTYSIAVGQPAHPTPTGEYEINDKQVDPTWYPPDSPWAAELDTIPPGPGNPLGTRWIGTTAPAIGIHGTYADSSIGTAASHGCMRMHIPDVEQLYDQVSLGMPVSIRP
jgi:lipoprotein-anchoring transpeptidase ErfK/SrfK